MDEKLFADLMASVEEMGEISRGEKKTSREKHIDAVQVKQVRSMTKLSQTKFANLIDVSVGTLRNWEQGRREPTGPARILFRAIRNDPKAVLKAIQSE